MYSVRCHRREVECKSGRRGSSGTKRACFRPWPTVHPETPQTSREISCDTGIVTGAAIRDCPVCRRATEWSFIRAINSWKAQRWRNGKAVELGAAWADTHFVRAPLPSLPLHAIAPLRRSISQMPTAQATPHGSTATARARKPTLATRCQPRSSAAAATTQLSTTTPARQPRSRASLPWLCLGIENTGCESLAIDHR